MIGKIVFFSFGWLFSGTIRGQRDIVEDAIKIEKLVHKLISHNEVSKKGEVSKLKKNYENFKKAIFLHVWPVWSAGMGSLLVIHFFLRIIEVKNSFFP